jgi:hemerythrin-like domain-containing protein
MEPDNPQRIVKLAEFRAQIEEHVRKEEEDLLPKLECALGEKGNAHVTTAMNEEGFKVV